MYKSSSELQNLATVSTKKCNNESCSRLLASAAFCKICMEAVSAAEIFRSEKCSHVFCRHCLRSYIHAKVTEKVLPVSCPEINCNRVLELQSCQSIISPEVFEMWGATLCESMIPESQRFYCPFKDCSALLVDDEVEKVSQSECPNCRRLFCAQCKVAWHPCLSCKEVQALSDTERRSEEIMVIALAKSKRWKRCPNCNFMVEKTIGCLHIKCRCLFEFCYGCGLPWSIQHAACHT